MYRTYPHPEFDINQHLLVFMQHHPFLAVVSRQIRKRCTRDISTAAVSYDTRTNEIVLWFNDLFMKSLTNIKVHGVLKHELYHLVFRHLTARRKTPNTRWNVATDMAIDWLVWHEATAILGAARIMEPDNHPLPGFAKTPGRLPELFCPKTFRVRPLHPNEIAACAVPLREVDGHLVEDFDADPAMFTNREPTDRERAVFASTKLIEAAPGNMPSEFYFDYLGDDPNMGGNEGGSMDEHAVWDDLPDDIREKVENEVRAIVAKAARRADTQSGGWGHIPAELCELIRRSVSTSVDWKALLLHFIGSISRGSTRRSITVRDRKYGLVQPGVTTGHTAHLVVVLDESGSVSSEMLTTFFAELESCTRKLSVTVLPFDSDCRLEDAWEWRKGMRPELKRTRCGGTDFDAPTRIINEHARDKGWEGAIFMTDGECSKPGSCNVKRAWILGAGCDVPPWLDDEIAIKMEDGLPATGAWH